MADQRFDFEAFNASYNVAIGGLQDSIAALKSIIPSVQEVAEQTGSAKLSRTTDSFVQVTEEQIDSFASVEESAEEVRVKYKKIDEAVN